MRFIRKCLFSIAGFILCISTSMAHPPSQATASTRSRARAEAARAKSARAKEIISLAGVGTGSRVADIGAGEGWLTVLLAKAVGPTGRVYAVDIAPKSLEFLRKRVEEERLHNVDVIEGSIGDPNLPSKSLDAAITFAAYHEMSEYRSILQHIHESLKPAGRLVLVEPTSRLVAPDRESQQKADLLSAQLAEDDLRKTGFHIAELHDPFVSDFSGRSLLWLIVAHRAPGVLLSRVPAAGHKQLPADGRTVVIPPGKEDIMRPDLRMLADEVQRRVSREPATIIDLRSNTEYRNGHIRGAILLTGDTETILKKIASRQRSVFLYCA